MRYQLFIVQSSFLSVYSIEMMLLYNFLDLVMIRIIKRLNHDYSKCLNRRLWHLATAVVGFAWIDSLFPKQLFETCTPKVEQPGHKPFIGRPIFNTRN